MTAEQQQQAGTPFATVSEKEIGYNVRQVDQFLGRARAAYARTGADTDPALTSRDVRTVSFDPAHGGYDAHAVDAALDRLEDAFVQRERDELVAAHGQDAWLAQLGKTAAALRGRLDRPDGERFRRPKKRTAQSYRIEDVDALCRLLIPYFEHNEPMSVDVVRRAVFASAKGAAGYEESQVDAFLDRVVEVLAAVD